MVRLLAFVLLAPLAAQAQVGTCRKGYDCSVNTLQTRAFATLPTCGASRKGRIATDATNGCLAWCSGSAWQCVASSVAPAIPSCATGVPLTADGGQIACNTEPRANALTLENNDGGYSILLWSDNSICWGATPKPPSYDPDYCGYMLSMGPGGLSTHDANIAVGQGSITALSATFSESMLVSYLQLTSPYYQITTGSSVTPIQLNSDIKFTQGGIYYVPDGGIGEDGMMGYDNASMELRFTRDGGWTTIVPTPLASGVTGTLPQSNGGTGTGSLGCATGQYLTSDGGAYSCAAAASADTRQGSVSGYWPIVTADQTNVVFAAYKASKAGTVTNVTSVITIAGGGAGNFSVDIYNAADAGICTVNRACNAPAGTATTQSCTLAFAANETLTLRASTNACTTNGAAANASATFTE